MSTQMALPFPEWRDVPGYEGIYQVSDTGLVRRIKPGTSAKVGQVMKTLILRNGYELIQLSRDNIPTRFLVHRLVLVAFKGLPPDTNYQANHINCNRRDNCLTNLEWLTPSENQKYSYRVGGRDTAGERNSCAKLTEDKVKEIKHLLTQSITQQKIADQFGVSQSAIYLIASGKAWRHIK